MDGEEGAEQGDEAQTSLLLIEAVNYSNCIDDVDDLSAIRGASDAMIALPKVILEMLGDKISGTIDIKFHAASQGLAVVSGPDEATIRAALETIFRQFDAAAANDARIAAMGDQDGSVEKLLPHLIPQLTWAFGLTPCRGNEKAKLDEVRAARNRSQMQRLSVDIPPPVALPSNGETPDTLRPCLHDWVRPRYVRHFMPPSTGPADLEDLSMSMALRRTLGRTGRRAAFYNRVIEGAGIENVEIDHGFSHDFQEIVEQPDKAGTVPDVIANKLAVIYFDTNKLSKHREALVSDFASAGEFANSVKELRSQFLKELLQWAGKQEYLLLKDPDRKTIDGNSRTLPVLRLETLLWGADEMMFVCPAWAIEPVLAKMSELLKPDKWTLGIGDNKRILTHATGVVLCNCKSPVRLMHRLAQDLAEEAKSVPRDENLWQYYVCGSLDMPTRKLSDERAEVYRMGISNAQTAAFTLRLDGVDKGFDVMARFKGESGNRKIGVPRGKLVDLLVEALPGELPGAAGGSDLKCKLAEVISKGEYLDQDDVPIAADALFTHDFFEIATNGALYGPLIHLLELWPYLGLDLKAPAAGAATP